MKNIIKNFVLNALFIVGLVGVANAQNAKDCHDTNDKVAQRSCYEQLVAYNLSEMIEYPFDAKVEGIEGSVVVRFTTDEDNNIQNVRVLGKPNQELSTAVIEAVHKLAAQDHKEMILANTVYRIPVDFDLGY